MPATKPLLVDRARAGIPLGTSLTIDVSGAKGPLNVTVPFAGLEAVYDPRAHRLQLTGLAAGSGTVTLSSRDGATATIAVLVAPPAGVIPGAVDVALAGTVGAPFAAGRIRDAIERALVRQPGTLLDVHGITLPPVLSPGDQLDLQAGVRLAGGGTYVDVTARTNVHVHVDALTVPDPASLFYSDDPEYVGAEVAGTLLRGTIDAQTAARAFVYHVAVGAPRRMSLIFSSAVASHVEMLGTVSGPSAAFPYIGQQSSARFLAARASGESAVVTVPAGVPYDIPLGLQQPGDLIEAIEDLRVVDGGPVTVAIVTAPDGASPALLDGPELDGDSHGRRGIFALSGIAPIELAFTAGAPEPAAVTAGDYCVVRPLALHLTNPGPQSRPVYLDVRTSGAGGATVSLWFDGDAAATLVPCLDDSLQAHLVKAFVLGADETRTITGRFMTDGASSYPIRFGFTATAPLPVAPGGCTP